MKNKAVVGFLLAMLITSSSCAYREIVVIDEPFMDGYSVTYNRCCSFPVTYRKKEVPLDVFEYPYNCDNCDPVIPDYYRIHYPYRSEVIRSQQFYEKSVEKE